MDCAVSLPAESCFVALEKGVISIVTVGKTDKNQNLDFRIGNWGIGNEPCEGLASSTAYAPKLNLDILDSLFGAAKKNREHGRKKEKKCGFLALCLCE